MLGARVLSRGMAWGDDVILSDARWFPPYLARALTYADVTCLPREQLYALAAPYPHSLRALRRATIMLAMRRGVVLMARQRREGLAERATMGKFLQRVHDASKNALPAGPGAGPSPGQRSMSTLPPSHSTSDVSHIVATRPAVVASRSSGRRQEARASRRCAAKASLWRAIPPSSRPQSWA